jgi:hypothetical protein
MGRGGKLDINIDAVNLADGEKVALRAVKNTKGGGHAGAMTGAMVATSLVFWPAAPLFLFIHGKDTTIPEGTEIVAYVNGDVPLDLRKFTPQVVESTLDIQANRRAAVRAASSQTVEDPNVVIEFTSIPTGADITIDGNYVGSTPSSITVAAGEHTISVAKPDYRPYHRVMTVVPGHPRVAATLEIQKPKVSLNHYQ